ncbi:hypothetical protein IAU60_000509 [Kwoniella sp. DSM 27419]
MAGIYSELQQVSSGLTLARRPPARVPNYPRGLLLTDLPFALAPIGQTILFQATFAIFTGKIVCSPDTKRMLLNLEPEVERGRMETGVRESKRLKYAGLRGRVEGKGKEERLVDRIEAVPYGQSRDYEIGYDEGIPQTVTITLLDANHCPGSTMFLITSADKAVLHTGDIRADQLFIQNLKRQPALQQYFAPTSTYDGRVMDGPRAGRRTLDRIYLDTGAVLGTGDMPDREPVVKDLLDQMALYPSDTIFFLDTWCFGWEYVVQEVSRFFGERVHVDRYKRSIYSVIKSDPYLLACTTEDPYSTRFHACERIAKCVACRRFQKGNSKPVYNLDKRIVGVNMVEIKDASWSLQHQAFLEALSAAAVGEGPWPYSINVPLARHSPLPELQNLVRLFRPRAISPNTVVSALKGLDYFLLPDFMRDSVADGAYEGMICERDAYFDSKYGKGFLQRLNHLKGLSMDVVGGAHTLANQTSTLSPQARSTQGRRANATEQLVRAGGLPDLTPNEVIQLVFGDILEPAPGQASNGRQKPAEYDTDEESPRKRRRGFVHDESQSSAPEASPILHLERTTREGKQGIVGKTHTVPTITPSIKLEDISSRLPSPRPAQQRKRAQGRKVSRFSLGLDAQDRIKRLMERDQAMLAEVAGDVEDEG